MTVLNHLVMASSIIDKFGRTQHSKLSKTQFRNTRPAQIPYTSNGDYNIGNKKLSNLSDPVDAFDAANKKYVENHVKSCKNELKQDLDKRLANLYGTIHNKILGLASTINGNLKKSEEKCRKAEDKYYKNQTDLENHFNTELTKMKESVSKLQNSIEDKIKNLNFQPQIIEEIIANNNKIETALKTKLEEIITQVKADLTNKKAKINDLSTKLMNLEKRVAALKP